MIRRTLSSCIPFGSTHKIGNEDEKKLLPIIRKGPWHNASVKFTSIPWVILLGDPERLPPVIISQMEPMRVLFSLSAP